MIEYVLTSIDRFLQKLNGLLLARGIRALLVVEPPKLLENLGMVGIALEHAVVSRLSGIILKRISVSGRRRNFRRPTYILLLFVNMANLEPDVFFCQRARGVANDVFETLLNKGN